MENNGLVLGPIPNSGGQIRITYPESFIRVFYDISSLKPVIDSKYSSGYPVFKYYLNKNNQSVEAIPVTEDEKYEELVLLSLTITENLYLCEFITKKDLDMHLIHEAMDSEMKLERKL